MFTSGLGNILKKKNEEVEKKMEEEKKQKEEDEQVFKEIMDSSAFNQMNSWNSLPNSQKFKMIDVWSIIILMSNFLHFMSALLNIFPKLYEFKYQKILDLMFGLATFMIWMSLTMYLQFNDELNILPATVKIVSNSIIKNFIAAMPIMLGLCFFCMSFFGLCWRFNELDKSVIMLWAIWNGDEL